MTIVCRQVKVANIKERRVISSVEQMNLPSCLYQQKTLKSLPMRSLPKQTHTCSQEKMPFRDKNQTVQINISMQRGMMLHRIKACRSPFSALGFLLSLLRKKFYIEGDKENHEAFSTYLQLLFQQANHIILILCITKKKKAGFFPNSENINRHREGFSYPSLTCCILYPVPRIFTTRYLPQHKISS